jgi:hypothetical protein
MYKFKIIQLFILMRIRIQLFSLMLIRIQLFTSMRIRIRPHPAPHQRDANLRHWPTDPLGLHIEPPRLHLSVHGLPRLHFQAKKVLNFGPNVDPDPGPASGYRKCGFQTRSRKANLLKKLFRILNTGSHSSSWANWTTFCQSFIFACFFL